MELTRREQLIWLAGILEGEGSFSLFLEKRGGYKRLKVAVCMADRDIIERAMEIFPDVTGQKIYLRPGRKRSPDSKVCKEQFSITWSDLHAKKVMEAVLPFMGERRSDKIQANLAEWIEYRTLTCAQCGVTFLSNTVKRRYCADQCRDARNNARRPQGKTRKDWTPEERETQNAARRLTRPSRRAA